MPANNRKRRSRKKKHVMHMFYFIKPKVGGDANELADSLINLESVEEVLLLEGDYGFLVRARFFDNEEPNDTINYITKRLGNRFSMAISHYKYTK